MMRKTPKCSLLNQQTPTRHGFHAGNRGPRGSPDNPPHGEVKKILNKENNNAHNSGPPNYLPKTTQNEILTKNYSISFRFFSLASFSFMLPPCPLPKMDHVVVALTSRVHRIRESLPRGPPSPQRPVQVVRTVGRPAEVPEQELQVAADPVRLFGIPLQPWRNRGWKWEPPP